MNSKLFIHPISHLGTIEKFIKHPVLWALTHGDQDQDLWDPKFLDKTYYLVRSSEGEFSQDIGIIETYPFTDKVIVAHYYIDPDFWGDKIGYKATLEGIKYLKEQTEYTSALIKVGKPHVHIQVLLQELGFKCIAKVEDAVVCNGEVTDLFLFQLQFNKE